VRGLLVVDESHQPFLVVEVTVRRQLPLGWGRQQPGQFGAHFLHFTHLAGLARIAGRVRRVVTVGPPGPVA
jgi:hypothetical protein